MKFSLIVPVYNTEQYLDKCLSSIFENTYKNYEVIIVNDGTKDNSGEIIKKYIEKYDNIIYVKQENEGLSSARNEGVKKATGDYICFIDSDDYIEKDMLKVLNDNLSDEPDLLRYQLREIYNDRIIDCNETGFYTTDSIDAFNKITRYKYIEISSLYVYKSSFYKQNNFEFKKGIYHEDFCLIPVVIATAKSIKSINYIGYNYLQREGSIMSSNDKEKQLKKMDDTITAFKDAIEKLNKINNSNIIKHFYANSLIDKYNLLDKEYKKIYKNKLKQLKVFNYFANDNIKRKIKKIIYKFKFEVGL